jgi:hypothetical protein
MEPTTPNLTGIDTGIRKPALAWKPRLTVGRSWLLAVAWLLLLPVAAARAAGAPVWLDAEHFDSVGGWQRDTQHVDTMGSVYLLATGLGRPVEDAVTRAEVPADGTYRLWVRCRDWLPSHSPGRFRVLINGTPSRELGRAEEDAWRWQPAGQFDLPQGPIEVRIQDLTGWWGRVDALVLAGDEFQPSDDPVVLAAQRAQYGCVSSGVEELRDFDVVVVGAGPSGLGAAVAAARHGVRVALVQDRPVVGGNSSSEIRVPPMGYLGNPPDRVNVTGLCEEFFPTPQGWSRYADSGRMEAIVRDEPGITLLLNTRATGVRMKGSTTGPLAPGQPGEPGEIEAVLAIDVRTGQRMALRAPLFVDTTGHAWIGYYAGAEYRVGEEARDEFGETLAPLQATPRTQGNSLYQAVIVTREAPVAFDCPDWAYQWAEDSDFQPRDDHRRLAAVQRPENFDRPSRGKGRNPGDDPDGTVVRRWWIEYGGMVDTVHDAETIRDELLRINLGLWNYAKNHNPATREQNVYRELVWLNYVPGVRESRRLMGPYVMSQVDFDQQILHQDTVAFTDWGPDVHHPEGFWVAGNDCIHVYGGRRVSIPYRTLYSRNVSNLMMAGRCHSATHIAMGGTRVMRPCMAMGQAAGTAAAIAVARGTTPEGVYQRHLSALQQALLKDGCYLVGVRNEDPADLARAAAVTASSAADGMPPQKVVNGLSRLVGDDRNAWLADGQSPHWIMLAWDQPQAVNVAHVTFERRAVPVRIEAQLGGQWRPVGRISRLDQRRYVVPLDAVATTQVRLVFARPVAVCEVRVYDEPPAVAEAIRRRSERVLPDQDAQRPDLPGVFLDDLDAATKGHWVESTFGGRYLGSGFLHDNNQDKGDGWLEFFPGVTGRFEVRLAYVAYANRATNVPVTVTHSDGQTTILVNQRRQPPIDAQFLSLGTFLLDDHSAVRIGNSATDGYVVVDGLQLLPEP